MNTASSPDPMSLPADALAGLRGYRLPDPVAWWPPAPGWWVVATLLLVAAGVLAWWTLRQRRCTAAAREAQRELARLRRDQRQAQDPTAAVRSLSKLLRRYVLAKFARHEVASLTGDAWLAFLDANGGGGRFRDGPGRQLVEAPYRPVADRSVEPLVDLVEDWIRHNREACR